MKIDDPTVSVDAKNADWLRRHKMPNAASQTDGCLTARQNAHAVGGPTVLNSSSNFAKSTGLT
jgi:hypothetical protein